MNRYSRLPGTLHHEGDLPLGGILRYQRQGAISISFYKIFFYFEAVVHDSTIFSFPAPTCIAHPGAILLHDYWAVYDPASDLPCVRHTPYNIGNNNIVNRPKSGWRLQVLNRYPRIPGTLHHEKDRSAARRSPAVSKKGVISMETPGVEKSSLSSMVYDENQKN